MVQRKAVIKPEKSFTTSHHFHQETRNRGGGEVKKKKIMNLQFDDAFKKSLPNYMKPTTCSGARKVTPVNPVQSKISCSGSKHAKNLVRKSSLKHVRVGLSSVVCNSRKAVKKATCSSTQKDFKFPKALDLNPGGTSVVRVCPYNYCSLNGHRHEALPPLKSFLESRRLAIKIEQRMKPKKEIDAGKKKKVVNKNQPLVEELGDDFFVEIYVKELVSCDQSEVVIDDNGSDCGSESSICEMDGMMSLIEYVAFDQIVKDVEENKFECIVSEQKGIEDAADSNDVFIASETVSVSHDVYEDVAHCDIVVSEQKGIEDAVDSNDAFITSEIVSVTHEVCEDVADCEIIASEGRGIEDAADSNDAFITSEIVSVSHDVCEDVPDEEASDDEKEENLVGDSSEDQSNKLIVEEEEVSKESVENLAGESAQDSVTFEQLSEIDKSTTTTTTDSDQECFEASDDETNCDQECFEASDDETDCDQECFEASDDETDGDAELIKIRNNRARASDRSLTDSLCDHPKLRLRITRKKRTEEEEMMIRVFNPRSPNFLPCQPEPDNEKVDLKHQEMDDRKNAEEWMVDYALRQAVTKLSPASKRKVALLVKAFETVIPMRIQACS
ncbi:calmodulin binding protein PICBP-like [Dioscorea cayenensis subsp. rotundata]|uniref:Calmodulin binding protein PICBP-like n=1 Tax=Dioscorea cayennensis subsp. rotundata TaxID=55577 RepID=A0AB40CCN3_DIOCR|nr:calmodulin binding protein PICBP-like [Dioscorea cayenensis subsp. rotundata]